MEKFFEIKKSVLDVLCDGAYLKSIGITDSDQEEVEFCHFFVSQAEEFTDLVGGRKLIECILDEVMKEYRLYIVTDRELESEMVEYNNCGSDAMAIRYSSIDNYINDCPIYEEETYIYKRKVYRF